jgi:hypothetical protein
VYDECPKALAFFLSLFLLNRALHCSSDPSKENLAQTLRFEVFLKQINLRDGIMQLAKPLSSAAMLLCTRSASSCHPEHSVQLPTLHLGPQLAPDFCWSIKPQPAASAAAPRTLLQQLGKQQQVPPRCM